MRRIYYLLLSGVVFSLTAGWYLASGRPASVLAEQHKRSLSVPPLTPQQQAEGEFQQLQQKIEQSPQDSVLWAQLGEYYLFNDNFADAQVAYQRALALRGANAELYSALATVLYYQAGQRITPQVESNIEQALTLDKDEVSALMLLAADAFMHTEYAKAITLWQRLLDSQSPRVNRPQLIEAVNMAKLLLHQQ
ncbi:heme lyase NrfEFG subunit NrfG [Serratia sp. arafor3]|uniref:Heme lyase NrfEFG subunit NrfG n=2 Tax=Serratia silvae TaxID=2824122 RepID=A0ABT0K9C0_9GAMM|nr:heme lyase NrfEFG subunit NrfG [Serratia silvae]